MSRLKLLPKQKYGYLPIAHPTPRVLGEVWNSYGRAKPTQIDPRNEREKTQKRTRKSANLTARDQSDRCSTPVRPVRPVVDTVAKMASHAIFQ